MQFNADPSNSLHSEGQRATIAIDTHKGIFLWFHFTAHQLTAAGGVEGVQARLSRQGYALKWEPAFKNPEKWAAIYQKER